MSPQRGETKKGVTHPHKGGKPPRGPPLRTRGKKNGENFPRDIFLGEQNLRQLQRKRTLASPPKRRQKKGPGTRPQNGKFTQNPQENLPEKGSPGKREKGIPTSGDLKKNPNQKCFPEKDPPAGTNRGGEKKRAPAPKGINPPKGKKVSKIWRNLNPPRKVKRRESFQN